MFDTTFWGVYSRGNIFPLQSNLFFIAKRSFDATHWYRYVITNSATIISLTPSTNHPTMMSQTIYYDVTNPYGIINPSSMT